MPPWLPEPGHEEFLNERRLSDEEIDVFARWHKAGSPEGDPRDAPQPPEFTSGWQFGVPDLVLESPEFELPASGPDRFRNFVLSVPEGNSHWVRAVELRPENPRLTHHIRLGIDTNNESVRRDAADDEPGYEGMAWGEDPEGQLITWTTGMQADTGTPGAAWQLQPDRQLVLHTHLQPSGKQENVRFRVGFYFADEPPTVHPTILRIGSREIDIPPNQSLFAVSDEYELPIDVDLHYVFPHAHSLAREIVLSAELPDGSARTLIAINRFDENWHDKYRFAQPLRLPKGTRLVSRFTYDNTTANIRNPHQPPQRVVYGSNADDEMADVYLQVIPVDSKQRAVLAEHYDQYDLQSKIVGYRKSLELYPDDPWSREALASCYVANKQPQEAIKLLQSKPQVLEQSDQAQIILGMAYLAASEVKDAEKQLREVLERDDKLPLAWLGLGQTFVAEGKPAEAEDALKQAIELAPQLMMARLDLIDLLVSQNRVDEAIEQCESASEMEPTAHQPYLKLANVYARQRRYDESLEQFRAARTLAPYLYSPQASLAIACYQFGDEQQAAALLLEAMELDPEDPVPHCFLGQIARRNEEWQKCRDSLQMALDLPIPSTWPTSHVHQFLILIYTEQLQVAQQTEDLRLLRNAAEAWLKIEPDNAAIKKLLQEMSR